MYICTFSQRSKNEVLLSASKSIQRCRVNLSYPICHYKSRILTMNLQTFQTLLGRDLKNIYNKYEQQLDEKAASSIHNITAQRNLTPLHGTQIVICVILQGKKTEICVKMHFSLVYKGLECVDLKVLLTSDQGKLSPILVKHILLFFTCRFTESYWENFDVVMSVSSQLI